MLSQHIPSVEAKSLNKLRTGSSQVKSNLRNGPKPAEEPTYEINPRSRDRLLKDRAKQGHDSWQSGEKKEWEYERNILGAWAMIFTHASMGKVRKDHGKGASGIRGRTE